MAQLLGVVIECPPVEGGQSPRKTVQAFLLPVVAAVENLVPVQVGYPEGYHDIGIARGEALRDGWFLNPPSLIPIDPEKSRHRALSEEADGELFEDSRGLAVRLVTRDPDPFDRVVGAVEGGKSRPVRISRLRTNLRFSSMGHCFCRISSRF